MSTPAADVAAQAQRINKDKKEAIIKLAQESRKTNKIPDPSTEPWKSLHNQLDDLLSWLETNIKMTPELKKAGQVSEILKLVYQNPNFHFQPSQAEKARGLHDRFESERWGAPAPVQLPTPPPAIKREQSDESDVEEVPSRKRIIPPTKSSPDDKFLIKRPPVDHPIWGRNGIMHGLAIKKNLTTGNKSKVLNDEYQAKDCSKFGDNGLQVGQWFPYRLSALFHGAHGHSQAGIHGSAAIGAYSVVVSGQYDELDKDAGDTIYYSGSGSHDNEDPNRPGESTSGTKALNTSLTTRKPVRVLRTYQSTSRWTPTQGLRYDGLYRVVGVKRPKNAKGGLYEQFKLVRMPDQMPLDECKRRPSPQDLRDYDRIERPFDR
ncbi:E3 ubiquitin-protein ligase ORTHRUS 1 [Pseudocercospora fuligena]|uniref:E3 ubiquitin-protein ligase ORTHRUS 1 n=1 Tax=Pseudocercospora fuligena TaxID=685502 RepID=A0A8H6RHR1_9PEZI|nr:E3 ubiquitin-protein ligase ORTHRUS 1 [Pseudocercospora fuligena]